MMELAYLDWPTPLLGVIALPVLAPLAALLQLLFPGLLKDQWQLYRVAIAVLMSQSTFLVVQWALVTWAFPDGAWWLRDATVAWATAGLAGVGIVVAVLFSRWPDEFGDLPEYGEPTLFEGVALGIFVVIGLLWMLFQAISRQPVFDPMTVATAGCTAGVVHLALRKFAPKQAGTKVTEVIMLCAMAVVGCLLALKLSRDDDDSGPAPAAEGAWQLTVKSDWPTHRLNTFRTAADASPNLAIATKKPELLWTFQPKLGSMELDLGASPAIVDGLLFVSGGATLITESRGYLFCVRTRDGVAEPPKDALKPADGAFSTAAGTEVWRIGGSNYRPMFASPIVAGGLVYFGEGYHQHTRCRMMAVDPRLPREMVSSFTTLSHTESSPTFVGTRAIFGAGDDGLLCVDVSKLDERFIPPRPTKLWQIERVHVDGSPLVIDGRAYVGAIVGDIYRDLVVLAVGVDKGDVLWRYPTDLPPTGCPALAGENIVVGLGNGKFGEDAPNPAGAMLAINRAKGTKAWRYDLPGSVLNAAAVSGDRVVFTCRDRNVYCLDAAKGELLWKRELTAPISAAPAIAAGAVFVVGGNGEIVCLNLADGAVVWRYEPDMRPEFEAISSPVIAEGRLYVAMGNRVLCLGMREAP